MKLEAKNWGLCECCRKKRSLVIKNFEGKFECLFCSDLRIKEEMHRANRKCPRFRYCWCGEKDFMKNLYE